MTQKLWAIQPRLWPQIEFFSPEAKNPGIFAWFSNSLSELYIWATASSHLVIIIFVGGSAARLVILTQETIIL